MSVTKLKIKYNNTYIIILTPGTGVTKLITAVIRDAAGVFFFLFGSHLYPSLMITAKAKSLPVSDCTTAGSRQAHKF